MFSAVSCRSKTSLWFMDVPVNELFIILCVIWRQILQSKQYCGHVAWLEWGGFGGVYLQLSSSPDEIPQPWELAISSQTCSQ